MLEKLILWKYQIIAFIASLLAVGGISGVYFYNKGVDSVKLDVYESKIDSLVKERDDLLSKNERFEDTVKKLNDQLTKIQTTTTIVTKVVRKEIEKPVYRDTLVPVTGLQSIADAARKFNQDRGIPGSTSSEVSTTGRSVHD